ncbi:MAG: alkaline phosphatase family protein [Bacteroidetes bacterium]|nr:alkaline phosphatase family protein [Bacteroidota bacterium]
MKKGIFLSAIVVLLAIWAFAPKQSSEKLLQSGPMLGYAEMKEVMLWVQTNEPSTVQFKYWEKGTSAPVFLTETYQTNKKEGYTARLIADEVQPGKTYEYALYINYDLIELTDRTLEFKSLPLWQFRTDPPNFSVAVGSCLYVNEEATDRPGKPYGGEYGIFEKIADSKPDVMVWLGDNTYFREPDWNTFTGMLHRHTHTRSIKELQKLLSSTHNYAIWDDHDYGPNDHNKSFIHKQKALDAFQLFWGNPTYGFEDEPCVATQFDWGDAQFFMLDNRWFRDANNTVRENPDYFGEKQLNWLINALKASNAHFKIVCAGGQIINDAAVYENYACYKEERARLLAALDRERINGVFFLSGDRHHAELSKLEREGAYPLYDLTTSPLTSGTHMSRDEGNTLQVPETLVSERNFALLNFSGEFKNRSMKMQIINNLGKLKWEKTLLANDLKYPVN